MLFKKIQEKREAEIRRQKKDTLKKVGAAFIIGSVISSVATLFTAPKSGKEMRQDVAEKVGEGAELVKDGATKVVKKTGDVLHEAVNKGQELKDKVINKVQNKPEIEKIATEAITSAEEKVEAVSEALEEKIES